MSTGQPPINDGTRRAIRAGKAYVKKFGIPAKSRLQAEILQRYAEVLIPIFRASRSITSSFAKDFRSIVDERKSDLRRRTEHLLAETAQQRSQTESEWLNATGEKPPELTIDRYDEWLAWWQERAARIGIDPNRILEAGDRVALYAPIVRGALERGGPKKDRAVAVGPSDPITLSDLARVNPRPKKKTLQNWLADRRRASKKTPIAAAKSPQGELVFSYSELQALLEERWPNKTWPEYSKLQQILRSSQLGSP